MLEFVIAFPVLLLIVLGLFDFSRIILAKTIIRSGALRASELATVIQNLELEDDVAHPDRTELRQEALLELYRRAVDLPITAGYGVTDVSKFAKLVPFPESERSALPANSFVELPPGEPSLSAVIIELPDPSTNLGVDINQIFQEHPIKIQLNAEVTPFLPFLSPVRFTERIEVYREPRNIATKPVKLDCHGDPLVPGEEVVCPCPSPGPGLPPPPNMVLNSDRTSCVCKDTYTYHSTGSGGCLCDSAHEEKTNPDGSKYCACRQGVCPTDPAHPNDPILNQNFSLKECKCVDSDCPTGTIVREDGSCGGCNTQNCAALGSGYVPDPNDNCACKTCDVLYGANPPRNGIDGVCVCANRDTDKPNCTQTQIWNEQQCKCVECGGKFVANAAHTLCECSDAAISLALQGTAAGSWACSGPGGAFYFDRTICDCRNCVYGGYGPSGTGVHIAEQTSSNNVVNIDGHPVPQSCQCNAYATGTTGSCTCIPTTCPGNTIQENHFCFCVDCGAHRTKTGPNNCTCNNLIANGYNAITLCPAGQAFHGGGCWCYACGGYDKGYSDKDYSNGYVCKCAITPAQCPANTHFVDLGIGGCDCVACTAADYQNNVAGCVCDPNLSGCSNTQSVDSTCQCHDCPPCQVRDPANPAQCMNPCGSDGTRCINDGLCCLSGQNVVNGPSGKVCVAANSFCETNPSAPNCVSSCTNVNGSPVCQLVLQE